jgi:hypothetical protein
MGGCAGSYDGCKSVDCLLASKNPREATKGIGLQNNLEGIRSSYKWFPYESVLLFLKLSKNPFIDLSYKLCAKD